MKRLVIAVALVAVFTTGALAQDYIFVNFLFGYKDYPLPNDPPCFSQHPVMPMVYDGSAWFVWTCSDGRVIPRRFFHAIDQTHVVGDGGVLNPPRQVESYDTVNTNWNGTGMTEAAWRARYPVR